MKRIPKKIILISTLLGVLVIILARYGYLEITLNREEQVVRGILSREPHRFPEVRIYRGKANYNLLEGAVLRSEDVLFLQDELRRLNIRRCVFAVRVRNVTEGTQTNK